MIGRNSPQSLGWTQNGGEALDSPQGREAGVQNGERPARQSAPRSGLQPLFPAVSPTPLPRSESSRGSAVSSALSFVLTSQSKKCLAFPYGGVILSLRLTGWLVS